jgi:predicted MFS family arabinose efflux permease
MGAVSLGLRANARQFALLVGLSALVGAMIGLERSVLPLVGEDDFGLESTAVILAFVVAFGFAKALANLVSGELAERLGRKRLLVLGWLVALPVPVLIGLAPSWWLIVVANLLLGVNQGFAWSMTVVMKIDLAGPYRRGLALGLNEAAGYLGLAVAAFATGALAASYVPRTVVWVGAAVIAVTGVLVSAIAIRDTGAHVALEQGAGTRPAHSGPACATRSCGRATRPGWSTTSTTRWHGALRRSTSQPTGRASGRSRSSPRPTRSSGAQDSS